MIPLVRAPIYSKLFLTQKWVQGLFWSSSESVRITFAVRQKYVLLEAISFLREWCKLCISSTKISSEAGWSHFWQLLFILIWPENYLAFLPCDLRFLVNLMINMKNWSSFVETSLAVMIWNGLHSRQRTRFQILRRCHPAVTAGHGVSISPQQGSLSDNFDVELTGQCKSFATQFAAMSTKCEFAFLK